MFDPLIRLYDQFTSWLFQTVVQPALYAAGMMEWADDAFSWMDFFVFGIVQVVVVYAVCRPLEAWRPVERWDDRRVVWTDVVYTMLARLGLLPLMAFVILSGVQAQIAGWIADSGWVAPTLETLIPALETRPLIAFALYILILDFGEYWRHRLQHTIPWWWALHSIHHAQEKMTFWTDDRNHVIDDMIAALWFGGLALLIGVPPGQFPLIVIILRVAESLSHANVRLSFGRFGERLLVSPRFHRLHHGVLSAGEEGRNYAVLFPIWDMIFRTGDFRRDVFPRTGDPEASAALVTGGWWRQQVEGTRRFLHALTRREAR
ncbi:sterol desaturase family protein [Roseomonas sp. SSH11]|uniref:Sterol desaturase family protein n=1 Tax=Pararoseomonas baculiformis TaxID=2820812 RepID=A0ABS4AM00_9PROT|nr:sterol desaturase family protein [Pararoseomonas baculiformis]MBP0447249.1 sterol desaturase family protein [Pararoseomonas baculiformis]